MLNIYLENVHLHLKQSLLPVIAGTLSMHIDIHVSIEVHFFLKY